MRESTLQWSLLFDSPLAIMDLTATESDAAPLRLDRVSGQELAGSVGVGWQEKTVIGIDRMDLFVYRWSNIGLPSFPNWK